MISMSRKKSLPETDDKTPPDGTESYVTVIAQDTSLKGTVTCRSQMLIAGVVEGDIDCSGMVRVAKEGRILANIYARKVVIEGEVTGNIESAEYVEISSDGRLLGNLKASKIKMAPGCQFDGEVSMRRKSKD